MNIRTALFAPVLGLLIATTASVQAEEQLLDRVVAIVNDDILLQSELERRSEVIRQQLLARNTALPAQDAFRSQVLDKMVSDQLQLQQAKENGFRVSDSELERTLERIATSNGLTLSEFKTQLEAEGQSYREVREQIRNEMLITRVRERLVNRRIKISDQEVTNFLDSSQGQRQAEPDLRLQHIMIPIAAPGTASEIRAATATIEQLYQQLQQGADFAKLAVAHSKGQTALEGGDLGWRNRSELPEQLGAAVRELQPGEVTRPFRLGSALHLLKLNEQRGGDVQLIEQTQVRHILIQTSEIRDADQARALITELRQRIAAGEPFDELARRFSDDPGSGSEGGNLGWASPGQMVPAFEQVMNETNIGQLSEPFESPFGWHILEVQARRNQDVGSTLLTNQARETIRKRKFAEEAVNWLRELRAQAYIETKQ